MDSDHDSGEKRFTLVISQYQANGLPHTELYSKGDVEVATVIVLVEGWLQEQKKEFLKEFFG